KVSGSDELKTLHPYDGVAIELSLSDDVGIGSAEVEYQINKASAKREPIPLEAPGAQKTNGSLLFQLAGKVKDGDEVRYRIRVADNRSVPEAKLGPNVVYYPADNRWRTLKVTKQAESAQERDILAQRDDVNRKIDAIKQQIVKEKAAVEKFQEQT